MIYVLFNIISYQEDGKLIMKGCVQWSPVYILKGTFGSSRDGARSAGQCLTYELLGLLLTLQRVSSTFYKEISKFQ